MVLRMSLKETGGKEECVRVGIVIKYVGVLVSHVTDVDTKLPPISRY